MERKKALKLIVLSVFLTLIGIGFYFAYQKLRTNYQIHKTLTSEHWLGRYKSFKKEINKSNEIIFLGNSLTEGFDLKVFHNPKVVNRGISGDYTAGVLLRLEEVTESYPEKIFIEIGINDIYEKVRMSEIVSNYERILNATQLSTPLTKIYIQSNLPTSNERVNKEVLVLNRELMNLSKLHKVFYIDMHDKFELNEKLNPLYTLDGIHLSEEGYKIWINEVERFVNENG